MSASGYRYGKAEADVMQYLVAKVGPATLLLANLRPSN
jgi:hypothetical protein